MNPDPSPNPFLRYRRLLDSYRIARDSGWSDDRFVDLVDRLDTAVARVDGSGFRVTPCASFPGLADAAGAARIWVKDDTGNVAGSHKARHLFGVALHHAVRDDTRSPLAIASCGNAALAAAVVARAGDRALRVFIPTWAEQEIVDRLERLGAEIEVCERRPDEDGDPTYLRFLEAVDRGATPFSVQGTVTAATIDGGRTLGWEAAEQLGTAGVTGPLRVFLQIGGGAMASAVAAAFEQAIDLGWVDVELVYHPVQTGACAPLARAWNRLMAWTGFPGAGPADAARLSGDPDRMEAVLTEARTHPDDYMWPWEQVGHTAADGIIDDATYDWLTVVEPTLRSGGWPIVVTEEQVVAAHRLGREHTGIPVSPTGTAGLAGLLDPAASDALDTDDTALVLFTGRDRGTGRG